MTRFVRFSEPASHELAEAVHWYETRRAGLGGELFIDRSGAVTRPDNSQLPTSNSQGNRSRVPLQRAVSLLTGPSERFRGLS